ncbi:unnamed protein product [Schistosoma rodhaini]|nr:unnamed protein product [Schistosoma rodhaini]
MSSYQSYSGVVHTNLSSAASVSADLIAHRGVWRKIISIIIFMGFLITSWATIVLHVMNFTNESTLELSVSISVLIAGQYIITGIVDGIIYWRRWNASSQRQRTKIQEQNKEAWVVMRITLTVLGMAPIARYIESLVVVKRMLSLEKQYMSETIALVKEVQQPSNLPSGSLISVPMTNTQLSQQRKTPDIISNPAKMRQLDTGLQYVRRVRRQFCRTEHDAAIIALTSGVIGAGPYAISQGILFYRRETMLFFMTIDTKIILLICTIFCMLWISTSFTHFYPVQYKQNELEYERGIGQVHIGGLLLLFIIHLIHITLRCISIVLFTGRFYLFIFIILIGHYLIVLITILIARQYTNRLDHLNHQVNKHSDLCENFFLDLLHSYINLYEFFNAGIKYTRTRYLIYYFFYYIENSIMIGLWYDYYQYPESWYYLPCLLVVILVQLLGFILLQIYLYAYSKSRRKTTLCGLCFMHKSIEIPIRQQQQQQQPVQQQQSLTGLKRSESLFNYNRNDNNGSLPRTVSNIPKSYTNLNRQQSNTILNSYPSIDNMNYTKSIKYNDNGIYDPIFGEQIIQPAIPIQLRNHRNKYKINNNQQFNDNQKSISELNTNNTNTITNNNLQPKMKKQLNESLENHRNIRPTSYRNPSTNNVPSSSDNIVQSTMINNNSRKSQKDVNHHHHHHHRYQHHNGTRTTQYNSYTIHSRTKER